jgi:molybdenum cofactor cytidylyltransferase
MRAVRPLPELLGSGDASVTCLAGAGGKTTLMWSLARRLAASGRSVACTTTTRVAADEHPPEAPVLGPSALGSTSRGASHPPLVVSGDDGGGKLIGLDPAQVDALAARFDHLVVEADGARGRPLKVPRPHEPVIPGCCTHLVVLLSVRALDRPASDANLFDRASLVESGRVACSATLDPATIRSLLLGPGGYLGHLSGPHAGFVAVNAAGARGGAALAGALWHPALRAVLGVDARSATGVRVDNEDHRVEAVVLAAGSARRFGALKQTVEVRGTPMVSRTVRAALDGGAAAACVVVGHEAGRVERALGPLHADPRVGIVHNPDHARGMGTSLAAGVRSVGERAGAVVVMLADMPAVDAQLVRAVVDAYRGSCARVAAPRTSRGTGHPVILRSELFDELSALDGDAGARGIVAREADRTVTVDPPAGTQVDVDTPDDLP